MEALYLKGNKVDWATDKISLKSYFNKYSEATERYFCDEIDVDNDTNEEGLHPNSRKIVSFLGLTLTDQQLKALEENCLPEKLAMEGENPEVNVDMLFNNSEQYERAAVPTDVELETFKNLRNQTKVQEHQIYTISTPTKEICLKQEYKKNDNTSKADINPYENFIVTVRVHFPFDSYNSEGIINKRAYCSQEITLHGDQTLDELKDVIICMEEFGDSAADVSENPFSRVEMRLKEIYTSSMFYFGNTFYIDRRRPENIDYSEVVRSWGAKRKIPMNRVESMENTKIKDLVIRFGYPYVYQHLGDCEHLIIFSDARLLMENDIRISQLYPKFAKMGRKHAKHCYTCKYNIAKWIVVGSERVSRDPIYVCNVCFRLYFYKGDKKNGSFEAFHYVDRRSLI